ncbi:hypothetical protein O5290_26230 [Escherichia coli]|nr:hypothetical protein [Escherichia coli]
MLAKEAAAVLTGDEFWAFIDKLATGRRLVITADHGYSNPALFPDVYPEDQKAYLKGQFKSVPQQRSGRRKNRTALGTAIISGTDNTAWQLEHCAGPKKWRSQGGYPSLAHGGLSLLEVACTLYRTVETE